MAEDYTVWLLRAKSSLALSKTKADEDIIYEDLCFQAQQAIEKALKAFLIFYHVEPDKTHNLVALIKELSKYIAIPQEVNDAVILNDYAVQTRYPGDYTPVDEEEYTNAIKIAENCFKWIDKKIKAIIHERQEQLKNPFLDNLNK